MTAALDQKPTALSFVSENLKTVPRYFLEPARLLRAYDRANFRPDLIAGLTVAVILLPQAIAFALIAELPPEMGLYAAIMGGLLGALWGSSNQIHTGPTNAISLLVFSALLAVSQPGTAEFLIAASLMAVMVGVFQLVLGLARLGVLVNFVSHSVVVGFSSGAGLLIVIKQLRPFMGVVFESHSILDNLAGVVTHVPDTHLATFAIGLGTVILILALRQINPRLPGALISMVVASAFVYFLDLDRMGVDVLGELPKELPPLTDWRLSGVNIPDLVARLSTGALAVGAIGLVETTAIARSIAAQTGQRLDSNQEFVGQGLANLASGLFSGYAVAGSFSRSAVNFKSGARTRLSSLLSVAFLVLALFFLAPFAVYVPIAALAGVLIVTAIGMIDLPEIRRIWKGAPGDALIMVVTLLGTLFLHIEFAVLLGIVLSLVLYIVTTSVPKVISVVPDDSFRHFVRQVNRPYCPQLGILDIMGDLYFGAANHVEEAIYRYRAEHPEQRFLLLRFDNVINIDFSGIHMLESVVRNLREQGGDVYLVRVHRSVMEMMKSTGFYRQLGADHFLDEDMALEFLFHKRLDPAVCIYECDVRVFRECQNLPKRLLEIDVPIKAHLPVEEVPQISSRDLWSSLRNADRPLIVDVREPREYRQAHIPEAQSLPLPKILTEMPHLPHDRSLVMVCRSGRRSQRAAEALRRWGYVDVRILEGGMLAWESADLLEAVE